MSQRISKLSAIGFALATFAQGSSAIIIRHDRDDQQYLLLGAKYQVSGFLQERVGCTLIAPLWAVTAAHTIEENPAFINYYVMFGGKRYEVEKIIIHPSRVKGTVDSSADLALLKLKQPVTEIKPALLYDRMDEADKEVVLAGYGMTGNGLAGQNGERGKLRAATNKIEGPLENSLLMVFDAPPFATELEGIGGAGDSGSPALYEEGGKLYIMGVGSFNSGNAKQGTSSKYGTFSGYARISTRRTWILETMKADPPDSLWSEKKEIKNNSFPKDTFGKRSQAFFASFNAGQEAAIAKFYADHRPPHPEGKTPQERAKGWQELMDQNGAYEVKAFSKQGRHSYAYLVYSAKAKTWRGVQIDFESKAPYRVTGIQMWDVDPQ